MWYVANFFIAICSLAFLPGCSYNHQTQACWQLCWSKGDYICDITSPDGQPDDRFHNYVYDPSVPTAVLMTRYRCADLLTGEHVTPQP